MYTIQQVYQPGAIQTVVASAKISHVTINPSHFRVVLTSWVNARVNERRQEKYAENEHVEDDIYDNTQYEKG